MQRLHVNDLTGYLEAGGGFHKLSFPAIALKDEAISLRHGEQCRRLEGEPLQQEREGIDVLRRIRDEIGAFNFASQYQQSPETPEGGLFKRKWFKFVEQAPKIVSDGRLVVSIDSALSTSESADYSAISLVYLHGGNFYVLFAERGRWAYEALKAKALQYRRRYGQDLVFVVEAAGTGHSLISFLRGAHINCLDYLPKNDKVARAARTLPCVESGRVHLLNMPGKNHWVEPYLNEFVNFPYGRFDDQVDSLVQLILCERRVANFGGACYVIY